ncbi:xanthine dehydrogenase [Edaphobacter acidisoli]|uniref:Xanthine dehydrogenase n=1 Tax=Edaphobacter acidisoli TaxID=2040573 RepID=A0A916RRY3_9BACT|nr:XdhC/CoxI family protein [Edaphobacter acidisoli]GGA64734.1 xanthine dehydrogenase [Edaphobacter acidisoli]
MIERRRIVRLWRQGGLTALVTLVRAVGSSYRRPGARLLLGATGEYAGTISGGCLEAEIVRKAAWMVRDGAVVERYSTMFDDTAEVPFGLGCGGVVDLLVEAAGTAEFEALMMAMERSLAGEISTVVTWLPGDGRALRRVVLRDGTVEFASEGLGEKKLACAHGLRAGEEHEGRFVEELDAPQRLFVLGAGDDAKPLVKIASLLGWTVIVADGRGQLARADRFPEAERVVCTGDTGIARLGIHADDAVVVMTHSYEQDRGILKALLPVRPRYMGLLGARHRSSLLLSEAAEALGCSVAECCDGLFAPVGLDLGGDGAEAIALAVMAEVHAVCQGKMGAARRLSAEDVSRYLEQGGASRYLRTHCALDGR